MKLKICGLTNKADVKLAVELGADYFGFIVEVPTSKRSISLNKFLELSKYCQEELIIDRDRVVAVLVNPGMEIVEKVSGRVQLHGSESVEFVRDASELKKVWKAISVSGNTQIQDIGKYLEYVELILLDNPKGEHKMSTQQLFAKKNELAKSLPAKILGVAGGITAENLGDFMGLDVSVIDVASGVEESPGQKSPELMKKLISKFKNG